MYSTLKYTLLDKALDLYTPWHSMIGKLGVPSFYIYNLKKPFRTISNISNEYFKPGKPKLYKGVDSDGNTIEIKFKYPSNTEISAEFYYDGKKELTFSKQIDTTNLIIHSKITNQINPQNNVELKLTSPKQTLKVGLDEVLVEIIFDGNNFKNNYRIGSKEWPVSLKQFNNYIQTTSGISSLYLNSLLPDIIQSMPVDTWQNANPKLQEGPWQDMLCILGTGIADSLTCGVGSGVYGALCYCIVHC